MVRRLFEQSVAHQSSAVFQNPPLSWRHFGDAAVVRPGNEGSGPSAAKLPSSVQVRAALHILPKQSADRDQRLGGDSECLTVAIALLSRAVKLPIPNFPGGKLSSGPGSCPPCGHTGTDPETRRYQRRWTVTSLVSSARGALGGASSRCSFRLPSPCDFARPA